MRRNISPEEDADRLLALPESNGFGAFKIRITDVMGRDTDVYKCRSEDSISTD